MRSGALLLTHARGVATCVFLMIFAHAPYPCLFCACILSRRAAHDLSDGTLASVPSRAALVQQNLFAGPSRGPLQACQACFSWPHRVPYCHHYGCHLTIAGIEAHSPSEWRTHLQWGLATTGTGTPIFGVGRLNPRMIRAPREGTFQVGNTTRLGRKMNCTYWARTG